ncbi:MAG: GTP-binding protein, partial [Tuberibacillus sp.]
EEALDVVEKTVKKIDEYFPDAKVTAFSPRADFSDRKNELSAFARSIMEGYKIEQERPSKMLHFIKMTIKSLLEKRVEMEKTILDRMEWNEALASKLTGALNQLSDIEEQKVQVIQDSLGKILGELRRDLRNTIPEILRGCSELVQDNSDIGKIHVEINDEMNRRVARFIEDTALPNFRGAVQMWIQDCEAEFEDTQNYFDELSDSFNAFYGEERMVLNGDFKVLEDWRRDVDRMTRGSIRLEKTNILLRSTPSQLLLKGAGKLFGAVSKNNEMLHNKYKQFIESKDYTPIAESISDQFMQQFEIFERSLERDIKMFFANPIEVLNKSLEEAQLHAAESRVDLGNIRKNPEIYRDPLAMFELRLHQFGWMSLAGERKSIEYF